MKREREVDAPFAVTRKRNAQTPNGSAGNVMSGYVTKAMLRTGFLRWHS